MTGNKARKKKEKRKKKTKQKNDFINNIKVANTAFSSFSLVTNFSFSSLFI